MRHVFTHFELTLSVREARPAPGWEPEDGFWMPEERLGEAALPSVMRKVVKLAL